MPINCILIKDCLHGIKEEPCLTRYGFLRKGKVELGLCKKYNITSTPNFFSEILMNF